MNRWKEQLESHAIHETLNWLYDSVSKEFDDLDHNETPEKRRLLKVISTFRETLEKLDPEILPFNQLDSLNTALRHQNIATLINAYESTGNTENLKTASDRITNQLTVLSILLATNNGTVVLPDLSDLQNLIDSSINSLTVKKDALVDEVSKMDTNSKDVADKLSTLEAAVEKQKNELSTLTTNWQSQFSTAQETRSQEFSKWRDTFTTEHSTEISEILNNFE